MDGVEDSSQAIEESGFEITEVVSGAAKGVDVLGEQWAESRGIPVTRFMPDYKNHGKGAPLVRNSQMARYADAVIVVWDGNSRGAYDMFRKATAHGLPVHLDVMDHKETK